MSLPIEPRVLASQDFLRQQFLNAQPFAHLVIPQFLSPAFCDELAAGFPPFDREKALNEMGEVGGKAVHERLVDLGAAYVEFDRTIKSPEFLTFLSQITGIPNLLYDPEYVGGGTHENRQGQDLDVHVDFNYHPHTQLHRRLNLIIFLNPEWREDWGGCLELHRNPWLPPEEDEVAMALPLMNQAVLFETTETSWHGFRRIQLPPERQAVSRKSLAVYFYTRERPASQTAASHSTVYVQRHLPEQIKAGYTLTNGDEVRIKELIARRDMQIRFLYEREKEFSSSLETMVLFHNSLAARALRLALSPLRRAQAALRHRHPAR